jgi:hypothetical protein
MQAIVDYAIAMLRSLAPPRTEQDGEKDVEMRDADQDTEVKVKAELNEEKEKSDELKENGQKKDHEDKTTEDGEKVIREPQEMFTEGQIQRKLFLYFALCTKKHDLLAG